MKKTRVYTLVFIKKDKFILLGLKTRGLGKGLWNGFGGKVEKGESVMDAARRELKEESNLEADNLKHIGAIIYEVQGSDVLSVIHLFTASETEGMIKVSEEMDPICWFHFDDVPFDKMWPDSTIWYPIMLRDSIFVAHVIYDSKDELKNDTIYQYATIEDALKQVDNIIAL